MHYLPVYSRRPLYAFNHQNSSIQLFNLANTNSANDNLQRKKISVLLTLFQGIFATFLWAVIAINVISKMRPSKIIIEIDREKIIEFKQEADNQTLNWPFAKSIYEFKLHNGSDDQYLSEFKSKVIIIFK